MSSLGFWKADALKNSNLAICLWDFSILSFTVCLSDFFALKFPPSANFWKVSLNFGTCCRFISYFWQLTVLSSHIDCCLFLSQHPCKYPAHFCFLEFFLNGRLKIFWWNLSQIFKRLRFSPIFDSPKSVKHCLIFVDHSWFDYSNEITFDTIPFWVDHCAASSYHEHP